MARRWLNEDADFRRSTDSEASPLQVRIEETVTELIRDTATLNDLFTRARYLIAYRRQLELGRTFEVPKYRTYAICIKLWKTNGGTNADVAVLKSRYETR
jgi:hypothetical protein